ncbi:unnamed protein product [Lactuca virosa]|uniref:Uncharacterized protein n=1 Tax=Lactuca virosa TaxID=75947 RepID=A0AAU9LDM9_9ASTR|nr:unnamed protein product [Lactuca virosa]
MEESSARKVESASPPAPPLALPLSTLHCKTVSPLRPPLLVLAKKKLMILHFLLPLHFHSSQLLTIRDLKATLNYLVGSSLSNKVNRSGKLKNNATHYSVDIELHDYQ